MKTNRGNSWNTTTCNRIVAGRNQQSAHEKHIFALQTIKGAVDHFSPPDQPHLRNKLKTKKLQEDRASEIQLENRILLQKMLNIDTKPSAVSNETMMNNRVKPSSLHAGYQRRELDRITKANQELLKRLQSAAPSVDPQGWEMEEEDRQALKFRISQNSCRTGVSANLRMPPKRNRPRLPKIHGALESSGEWDRLANDELDHQLRELEQDKGVPIAPPALSEEPIEDIS